MVVGGTIPREDSEELKQRGVAEVFTPGRPDERDRRLPARARCRRLIHVEREDAVALVTIDRPEAHERTRCGDAHGAARRGCASSPATSRVRAVIVTGAGEKAFVAGADIKYMSGLDVDAGEGVGRARPRSRTPARDDAEADDRGHQRFCARRRLRARARVRHPLRRDEREARPARGEPRDHSGLGRHAATRTRLRPRRREGADLHRAGSSTPKRRFASGSSMACTTPCSTRRARWPRCSRRRARSRCG